MKIIFLISKKKWDYIRLTELYETVDNFLSKLKIYAEKNGLKDEDGVKYTLSADSGNATIEQVREKWSKYNQDKASKLAFGEAKSQDQGFAVDFFQENTSKGFYFKNPNGRDPYMVGNIRMDIVPIKQIIESIE